MHTYIALFRGINVGGNRSLPMKDLVALLSALGCLNVKTYIQSGNAVFQSGNFDPAHLRTRIISAVEQRFGFAPDLMLLSPSDMQTAIDNNPFPEAIGVPKSLHLGFLASVPTNPDLAALERLKAGNERYALKDKVFYLHAPDGIGRSKLAARSEKALGVPMTDRNWATVIKLNEMVQESS